jgi:hypothetical protein
MRKIRRENEKSSPFTVRDSTKERAGKYSNNKPFSKF